MESHKRILAILYIVSGSFQLLIFGGLSVFLSVLFPLIASEAGANDAWILELLGWALPGLFWILILLFAVPSIVGGIALLQQRSWALTLLLIMGCFKLFSFPIGTALGVYTIWVYAEVTKK
ncbi:MAG: hypothetical protein KF687_07660 [Cyclobacteriaceae bacterium]|nr:hypothetical protein [Cyclobacteriaceae bacterium]